MWCVWRDKEKRRSRGRQRAVTPYFTSHLTSPRLHRDEAVASRGRDRLSVAGTGLEERGRKLLQGFLAGEWSILRQI